MSDDSLDLGNRHADDAANRLTSALNRAHDIVCTGIAVRDIENLIRVLHRAHDSINADEQHGLREAIVDEDASFIVARAEEAEKAIQGIYLTAERLMRRAEEIRVAAADLRNAVELSGDDNY